MVNFFPMSPCLYDQRMMLQVCNAREYLWIGYFMLLVLKYHNIYLFQSHMASLTTARRTFVPKGKASKFKNQMSPQHQKARDTA